MRLVERAKQPIGKPEQVALPMGNADPDPDPQRRLGARVIKRIALAVGVLNSGPVCLDVAFGCRRAHAEHGGEVQWVRAVVLDFVEQSIFPESVKRGDGVGEGFLEVVAADRSELVGGLLGDDQVRVGRGGPPALAFVHPGRCCAAGEVVERSVDIGQTQALAVRVDCLQLQVYISLSLTISSSVARAAGPHPAGRRFDSCLID
jgi:hypothetical protein